MANDERDMYKKYVDELPALNFNITEFENLKREFGHRQDDLKKAQEEISSYKSLVNSLDNKNNENLKILEEKYIEQVVTLQNKNEELERLVDTGSSFLRDQNETLLQEIRRLKAEMAGMSSK
jgi:septal ring factor EnvC (AmiA/AmiB activator)